MVLQTCLQLSSPELMRKLPNGDTLHHLKNNSRVSTLVAEKDKEPTRERGKFNKSFEEKKKVLKI